MTLPGPADTVPAVLTRRLRDDPGRPVVTWYDDRSGERVELSVATYATWVAKTAGLLQDELGTERGDLLLLRLPPTWLAPAWLGAAWAAGLTVTDDAAALGESAVVVCGPDDVAGLAAAAGVPVVALSLRPMAARFEGPLPPGVLDYGAVVWGQPDSFTPYDPPRAGDGAWRGSRGTASQAELLARAAATPYAAASARLLTDVSPAGEDGAVLHLAGLLAGGTVWVGDPDPAGWEHRAAAERATHVLRASGDQPTRS